MDETQDMTLTYYNFVKKIINDIGNDSLKLLILGDEYQCMYNFREADIRFLTLAHKIWPSKQFLHLQLSASYRLTIPMAWFVNTIMIGEDRITTSKPGGYKVDYVKQNAFTAHEVILPEILKMIGSGEIKPDDIFILAPSIKSPMAPIKHMENVCVLKGLQCFMPLSDTTLIDDDIIKNKVVFSSVHQAKGRERPVVVVMDLTIHILSITILKEIPIYVLHQYM